MYLQVRLSKCRFFQLCCMVCFQIWCAKNWVQCQGKGILTPPKRTTRLAATARASSPWKNFELAFENGRTLVVLERQLVQSGHQDFQRRFDRWHRSESFLSSRTTADSQMHWNHNAVCSTMVKRTPRDQTVVGSDPAGCCAFSLCRPSQLCSLE